MNTLLKTNALESEAIYILREVIAQFEKPVLLFSGGKDSITLVRLAQKAFYPSKIPFPLLHIDTGHNFPETIAFRDKLVKLLGVELIVRNVQDSINLGKVNLSSETDYTATQVLINTSNAEIRGTITIAGTNGAEFALKMVNGTAGPDFTLAATREHAYAISVD